MREPRPSAGTRHLPRYIPERFYAADLGKGLAKQVKQNERVCILRARHGSPELTQAFEAAGISYMDVTLRYDHAEESPLAERIRELLKRGRDRCGHVYERIDGTGIPGYFTAG